MHGTTRNLVDIGYSMASASQPGRPAKTPESPLGAVIAGQAQAKGIRLQTVARRLHVSRATLWRWLNGRTTFSRRITTPQLCQALGLDGEERVAFMRACAPHVQDAVGNSSEYLGQSRTTRVHDGSRFHPSTAEALAIEWGGLLAKYMDARQLSQSKVAHQLNVAPSTVSRLTRGQIATTHAVSADELCRVLDLDKMSRRAFLTLAMHAGVFPLIHGVSPARLRFHELERALGHTLPEIEEEITSLRERRNHGEVAAVYRRARELFQVLVPTSTAKAWLDGSRELARAKLVVGFEYCEAQAAHLDWYARIPAMMQTLNQLESDVLQHFPVRVFASEINHLLNVRGPLYYKMPAQSGASDGYQECIRELTGAIENLRSLCYEPALYIELLRNRAHAYLLQGTGHEQQWSEDLKQAEREAEKITTTERDTFQALVEYSWAEGCKHLQYRLQIPLARRREYMRRALRMLSDSEKVFENHYQWGGYDLLAKIAEAQCLTAADADEALRRLKYLRIPAQRLYPSLLAKIQRAETLALRHKQGAGRP